MGNEQQSGVKTFPYPPTHCLRSRDEAPDGNYITLVCSCSVSEFHNESICWHLSALCMGSQNLLVAYGLNVLLELFNSANCFQNNLGEIVSSKRNG